MHISYIHPYTSSLYRYICVQVVIDFFFINITYILIVSLYDEHESALLKVLAGNNTICTNHSKRKTLLTDYFV